MARTKINHMGDGEIYVTGGIHNEEGSLLLYALAGYSVIAQNGTTQRFVMGGTCYAKADLDYSTTPTYPRLLAVATCTKANETYAKLKVGGTIKRILCYDDA